MTKSSARSARASITRWVPSLRGLLLILAAFGFGLLAFLLWMAQRPSTTPQQLAAPVANGAPQFAPLPAPMAGNSDGASGLEEPDEDALADRPHLIEAPRPPPEPAPPADAAPAVPAPTLVSSAPTPLSSPAPRYPDRSMRRRETGTVRLQVEVGVDGEPTSVTIASSSNSRDLDRAAMDAVRKWRFRPALREGQPVVGTIIVPIEFKL
ncbi:energy transducer TonB [Lysobacter sp. KIS68-7]|uniref:energy transducer TonB n=1 Tax=Lysobacter sp. KIS68-7 TaxID=2904252 RepID=UPI001E4E6ACD|nr:energy transducer TonB [Lysobacter sp. KIS68-7]UHQ18859.1 energy transducer TonB [Lysobacter sp. KIS68-7]